MGINTRRRCEGIFCIAALFLGLVAAGVGYSQKSPALPHWVGTWAASQQIPEPQNALSVGDLQDATLRQIVHLSIGGKTLRVRLSNAFGTSALHLTSVHLAKPLSAAASKIDVATDRRLLFSGSEDVLIPPGAEYISDPIDYPSAALSDIAITMHIDTPSEQQTGHPGSRATSYITHGDAVSVAEIPGGKTVDHWYMIAGVDVIAPPQSFSVVALGDSITDGHGTTTNGNDRWTDVLARRFQADVSAQNLGVLNQGIGGNHLLTDGLGPNALARFDRDVLAQTGVRYVIVLEGINDLGGLSRMKDVTAQQHDDLIHRMIGAYEQITDRAHERDIKVIGATIMPDIGSEYYHPGPSNEADRQKVNQWIRTAGFFDAVVDLDKVMADPADPRRLLPSYDSGDHLHPSPMGYYVMGEAFRLSLFSK
jgi:lysophospholipase L1-like esterase